MVYFENRSAADIKSVSTGSAEICRLQASMRQMVTYPQKTLVPGALERGFVVRSSRNDSAG